MKKKDERASGEEGDCREESSPHLPTFFSEVGLLEKTTLLLLLDLQEERTVDAGQHTSEGDSGTDKSVEFLITTDGELQVARGDTLDLEILGGVACQFEDFGSEVLEDSGHVNGSCSVLVGEDGNIWRL